MSYNKRTWANGNVVGAVDLNRIEQGIEDAGSSGSGEILVVNSVYNENNDSYTLDKTWQEIYDAFPLVAICTNDGTTYKESINTVGVVNNSTYAIVTSNNNYQTFSSSGYPISNIK